MKMIIPKPLKLEHKELHIELVEAVKTFGPIGKAVEAVAKVLHPHFVRRRVCIAAHWSFESFSER